MRSRATADRVVTVSEHSKADITRIPGIAEERVTVAYQAGDLPERFSARPDDDVAREVENVFGLGWRDYFIFGWTSSWKTRPAPSRRTRLGAARPATTRRRAAAGGRRHAALTPTARGQERAREGACESEWLTVLAGHHPRWPAHQQWVACKATWNAATS